MRCDGEGRGERKQRTYVHKVRMCKLQMNNEGPRGEGKKQVRVRTTLNILEYVCT